MTKVRIFDLSKILDVSNKDLIDYLKDERGISVKSHSSSIDQTMANEIIAEFRRRKKAMKEGKTLPPRVAPQPQPQVTESARPVEKTPPAAMDKPIERAAAVAPTMQERTVSQSPKPAETAPAARPQEQVTAGPDARSSAPVVSQPVPQEKPIQTPRSEVSERPAVKETPERTQAPVRHEHTERPARTGPPQSHERRQGDDRRPQQDRRPGEGRPYQGRSDDNRPHREGGRPQGDRPQGEGRPWQNRQDGSRPPREGGRPQGDRPQGDRPPYQNRQDGSRPPRPQGEGRPWQNRSDDNRPPREGGRPQGDRPQGDRPPYQNRQDGSRPPRPQGEGRPWQNRSDDNRPPREGGRPQGDRPPYQNRQDGSRPPRPQGEGRPYQPRTGGGGYQGGGGFGRVPDKDADERKPFDKKQGSGRGGARPGARGPRDVPPPPDVKEPTRKEKDRGFKAENKYTTADPEKAKPKKKRVHKDFKADLGDEMEVIINPLATQVPGAMEVAKPEEEKVVKPVLTTRTKTFSLASRHRDRRKKEAGKAPEVTMKESTIKWMEIPESITVGDLAKQLEVQVNEIIKILMLKGIMASINQNLTFDLAASIVKKFGFRVEQKKKEEVKSEEEIDDPKLLSPRPPVVTVLGHVDHGKTSLLDYIRKTNVAAHEDGGITQSIGAYTVEIDERKIVFLDTPGHEAFTEMRARGARVTDIAVLVVAADDGVMPQTVEAISHAKAAGVPVIVAINKIDKPEANPERVKQQMAEHDIVSEDWGGDVIMVPVSARSGMGIEDLLEMILLVADVQEFKANPHRLAEGTIIESFMDTGHGPVATVVVQNGTLNVGDVVLVGNEWGRVKALLNDKGKRVKKAFPSTPVKIIGLSGLPEAGDHLQAIADEKEARDISDSLKVATRDKKLQTLSRTSLDDLYRQMQAGEVKDLNIVLKADVNGSLEAARHSLQRLSNVEVNISVLHGGVGAINKTDVMLAKASGAIIIGFNVRPDPITKRLADQEQVDIRVYRVIYQIIDDVKAAMLGLLKPEFEEVQLGRAEVRAVFKVSKVGFISGCYVTEGKITRGSKARVIRDGVVVFEGKIDSLRRFKDDVKEVETNFECGIGVDKFGGMQPGDIIEAYAMQEVKRDLSDVEQLSQVE